MLQKVRKQGIRFWDERTFWHEIIYKSLIPTFGSLHSVGLPKVDVGMFKNIIIYISIYPINYVGKDYLFKLGETHVCRQTIK